MKLKKILLDKKGHLINWRLYFAEFRREFGQPLGKYFTRIKNTFKNFDSPSLNEQRSNMDNGKEGMVDRHVEFCFCLLLFPLLKLLL